MNPNDYNELPSEKRSALAKAMEAMVALNVYEAFIRKIEEAPPETVVRPSERLEILLSASVPRGYVKDMRTGTLYKLETWLERVATGLALWEDARKGIG